MHTRAKPEWEVSCTILLWMKSPKYCCKYYSTSVVAYSDKHSSLVEFGIKYDCKNIFKSENGSEWKE